jgi:hypothetical protein
MGLIVGRIMIRVSNQRSMWIDMNLFVTATPGVMIERITLFFQINDQ